MPPTPAPAAPRAVAAVLLFSPRPDALAAFYRDVVGLPMQPISLPGLDPHYACELRQVYLSIWTATDDAAAGAGRAGVALMVVDVAESFARLSAAGCPVDFPPRDTPVGIVARLRDPDGNVLELYAPPPAKRLPGNE